MLVATNSKTMHKCVLLLLCFSLFGCLEVVPQKPLNVQKDDFIKKSVERNKAQVLFEQEMIQKAIQKDSLLDFQASSFGFWFAYLNKTNDNIALPTKGDQAVFTYQIEDLNKTVLYEQETLGTIRYNIDEEELLPALREGLRIMRPNEVVVFLFPSYLCYSYQGDGEKIGINQPLRFVVHLKSLTKK